MLGEWGPKNPSKGFIGKKHTEETKKKISENNGSRLDELEIKKRINDWNSLGNVRGKITKISNAIRYFRFKFNSSAQGAF